MEWSSFFGAFVGVVVSLGGLIGGILIWDKLTQSKPAPIQPAKTPSLDDLREIQLEQDIVQRFDKLFPGWRIYNSSQTGTSNPNSNHKQTGIRYRTDAGEIDILCLDTKNNDTSSENPTI
ncbi:MAG: hypothetical protein L6R45_35720 [Anaerolineae bacterium]|nr:hypothetical protein [Anaerolineae bacterium]